MRHAPRRAALAVEHLRRHVVQRRPVRPAEQPRERGQAVLAHRDQLAPGRVAHDERPARREQGAAAPPDRRRPSPRRSARRGSGSALLRHPLRWRLPTECLFEESDGLRAERGAAPVPASRSASGWTRRRRRTTRGSSSARSTSTRSSSGTSSPRPATTALSVPEEYGGQGGDVMTQMVLARELCRSLGGLTLGLGPHVVRRLASRSACTAPTSRRSGCLPAIAEGKLRFSIGFTEPDGGTDVLGAMKTQGRAGRRRLEDQRHQDLVLLRPRRRLHPAARPHRRRRRQAPPGRDAVPAADAKAEGVHDHASSPSSACARSAPARSTSRRLRARRPTCSASPARPGTCCCRRSTTSA